MEKIDIVDLKESILEDNNQDADKLRKELITSKTYYINVMSSPGSGKTTTLLRLLETLNKEYHCGVMEADIDSDVDAKIMMEHGIESVQLHTGGMCHLDADMSRQGIAALNRNFGAKPFDVVFLENVGNLVCPAEFDTGAVKNMTILSVPEGDDKPQKYPLMYETCDLLVVNKTDVLPYFDFDKENVEKYARLRNPNIDIIYISAKTGEGIDKLADWIVKEVQEWRK